MSDKLQSIIQKYAVAESVAVDAKALLFDGPEPKKVFLYSFYCLDLLSDAFVADQMHRLPAQRQIRCAGYRRQSDKKACLLSYLFLEDGLREHHGIIAEPSFVCNEHGKPYLRDTPHIFFSFSHSGNAVGCAIADFEVGLDIQEVRPFKMGVARRVCSESELRQLAASEDAPRLFCKFWTQRESYAKACGVGVPGFFKRDLASDRLMTWEDESFYMSLCIRDTFFS